MYCILTKSDLSWKLPVTWIGSSGSQLAKKLFERDGLYYQKNIVLIWPSEELFNKVGVVHLEEPNIPPGKKTSGSIEDTLDGFVVTRKAPWIDDPDYVAPDTKAIAKEEKIKEIKLEAEKRILVIAPEWKQRNFAFLHQQVTDGTVKTASEADGATDEQKEVYEKQKTEWADQKTMWGKVSVIRSKSDELEISIKGMDDEETVHKFDVSLDSNWE